MASKLIAVPSNDGTNIFPKMLGLSRYFFIYATTNGKEFTFVEKRINPYEKTFQHLKTLDVYELISDCEVIISALIGKKGIGRLKEKGVKIFIRQGDIQGALNSVFRDEFPEN